MGKNVRKLVAFESHRATVEEPRTLIQNHLPWLHIHLHSFTACCYHLQRPTPLCVAALSHLQHSASQMSVVPVDVVDEHRVPAIHPDAESGGVFQRCVCPPLQDLPHLVDDVGSHVREFVQVQLVHRHQVDVGVVASHRLMLGQVVLLGTCIPWQQDFFQLFSHIHVQKPNALCEVRDVGDVVDIAVIFGVSCLAQTPGFLT
mmetsp:Transcript_21902/g.43480  ORF Transcript_21902/g.43480 Transcript_21902/m.43480 type:complete len:202 (-) Transcript_21902:511-1116(-)